VANGLTKKSCLAKNQGFTTIINQMAKMAHCTFKNKDMQLIQLILEDGTKSKNGKQTNQTVVIM